MDVSIVVPIFNEFENIDLLYREICDVIQQDSRSYEILLVDDGSTDGTVKKIREIAANDNRVRPIFLRRNFGQTAAMKAGFDHATGRAVVTMDGDLQNDPADIPQMLDRLDEGYDLVHGWRKNRQDKFLSRKLPSKIANWIISRSTGFPIHDLGCTLKVMRLEFAKEIELYGEMHRFIPILANRLGAKCIEVETHHRPRQFGTTKYGIGRTTRVILDLMTVKYILSYFASPMKFFGRIGLLAGFLAFMALVGVVGMKLVSGVDMTGNPLLLLSVISAMASIQFFSLGLLGEVNARIYFNNQQRSVYAVRETLNHPDVNRSGIQQQDPQAAAPTPLVLAQEKATPQAERAA